MAGLGYAWATSPLEDNSFLTHLATGRLILETGGVPKADPYTFTAFSEPWVVQSWLASLVYAVLERLGGLHAIQLFTGALVFTLVAQIWSLTAECRGVVTRAAITTSALIVGMGFWSERPLLLGFNFLALTMLALVRRSLVLSWALVPLGWIWVNVHGSWPLGVAACLLWHWGYRFDSSRLRPRQSVAVDTRPTGGVRPVAGGVRGEVDETSPSLHVTRRLRGAPANPLTPWLGLSVGCIFGAIGPLGLDGLSFPVRLLAKRETLAYVVEWQPPPFDNVSTWAFAVQLVWLMFSIARRPSYQAAMVGGLVTVLALSAARNVPVASIVMSPLIATGSADFGRIRSETRGIAPLALVFASVLIVMGVTALRLSSDPFDWRPYPLAALAWLVKDQGVDLGEQRLVAPDIVGNLAEGLFSDEVRVFYDDRFDMFPLEVSRNTSRLLNARPSWSTVLDESRADYVLWYSQSGLASLLAESDRWHVVFIEEGWLLAERRR